MSRHQLWDTIRYLTYTQHGGSGTNLTLSDVLSLELRQLLDWADWLGETRESEAAQIKKANGGR